MNQFTNNVSLLIIGRVFLFVVIYIVSTTYFLPRGIQSFMEWKKNGQIKLLEKSINLFSAGVFFLVYLLVKFVSRYGL